MKKIGRYRRRKQNKIIIMSTLSLLLFLCVGYAAFSTNLTLTAKGNIKEKSRVIQAWNQTSETDFHAKNYRHNIVSVTFLDNNNVPSNKVESWNVSEDKENGGVLAWVIPSSSDNTKYDLYIGAKGGVIANESSSFLFYNFLNLKEINFNNNYNTENVIYMQEMFAGGNKLITLDLSDFDTRNVTNMLGMFTGWYTPELKSYETTLNNIIFGDNFITSNVTIMSDMFSITDIKNLDLSFFDTSKVTNMYHMFSGCDLLENLNICSFDISNVSKLDGIFLNTKNLKKVYVGSTWKTENATTSDMFTNSAISSVTTGQC